MKKLLDFLSSGCANLSKAKLLQFSLITLVAFATTLIWYFSALITNIKVLSNSYFPATTPDTSFRLLPSRPKSDYFELVATNKTLRKRKGLLLLTYHRSGSTFFGQFFNQRPDVFYIFEPLITFEDYCFVNTDEVQKVHHLLDLFSCRFRDQREIFRMLGKPLNSEEVKGIGQKCIPNNFCFRQKMKLFCTKEFCRKGNVNTCFGCEAVDKAPAYEHCSNSKLVVIKVIRLCQVQNLKPIFQDPSLDLKIVHLIRDPRGVYNSRVKVLREDVEKRVKATCDAMHDSIQQVLNKSKEWLQSRYKLVRYEDLCLKPLQVANDIYNFVGLNMTKDMKNWILKNTNESLFQLGDYIQGQNLAKKIAQSKVLDERGKTAKLRQLKTRLLSNPYTTARNSSTTWLKWLNELDERKLEFVQNSCENVMNDVGYNLLQIGNRTRARNVVTKTCPNRIHDFCSFS